MIFFCFSEINMATIQSFPVQHYLSMQYKANSKAYSHFGYEYFHRIGNSLFMIIVSVQTFLLRISSLLSGWCQRAFYSPLKIDSYYTYGVKKYVDSTFRILLL